LGNALKYAALLVPLGDMTAATPEQLEMLRIQGSGPMPPAVAAAPQPYTAAVSGVRFCSPLHSHYRVGLSDTWWRACFVKLCDRVCMITSFFFFFYFAATSLATPPCNKASIVCPWEGPRRPWLLMARPRLPRPPAVTPLCSTPTYHAPLATP
jgi:hypothetical protein